MQVNPQLPARRSPLRSQAVVGVGLDGPVWNSGKPRHVLAAPPEHVAVHDGLWLVWSQGAGATKGYGEVGGDSGRCGARSLRRPSMMRLRATPNSHIGIGRSRQSSQATLPPCSRQGRLGDVFDVLRVASSQARDETVET